MRWPLLGFVQAMKHGYCCSPVETASRPPVECQPRDDQAQGPTLLKLEQM